MKLFGKPRMMVASLALATTALATLAMPVSAEERALIIARDMDLNSLDPQLSWCDTCQIYNTAVYEQLTTLDLENRAVPLLAESWSSNDDQTEFTFILNPNARFADGSPVEAKDVKWTFERMANLQGNSSFMVATIESVEAPDAHTVVVTLNTPNSEFPQIAAAPNMAILNSTLMTDQGAVADETAPSTDTSEAWMLANSAGSGPFVLESYEPNSELRLARNDNYWRDDVTVVPEVVFRQVKDAVAQAQMLQTGAVDIAMQIDPETAKSLTGDDVVVDTTPSFNFVYLTLAPGAQDNTIRMTPEVREAVSLGIDREGLIDVTLSGTGQRLAAPIPIGFPGSTGHAQPEYDPDRAREMLAEAGHPEGFSIQAVYPDMNVYGVDFGLAMQKVQQDLSKIGVEVSLSPVPFTTWVEQANSIGIPMSMVFYAPDFYGTSQYVDYFGLGPDSVWAMRATGSGDAGEVVNTEITAVRNAALAAPTPEEAEALWFEAGEMMINDHIILPLVSPDVILAYRSDIEGVRYSACCNLPLAEISN